MDRKLHRLDSTYPGQCLYLVDGGGVVFSETQNRFVGLDAAGVAAYRAFNAGVGVHELRASHDGSRFSSPPAASEDGLETIHALSQGIFPGEDTSPEWPALHDPLSANLEIHGIPVFLEYPAGPFQNLCLDYFRNCSVTTRPAQCHLQAQQKGNRWAIHINGGEFLSGLQGKQIGLGLLHAARALLYAEAQYDIAFHAAMVAGQGRGVMLCAPRESGKSTLTAHLVARGFDLLADEPTLLHLDTASVSPLHFPVSLKEGSWNVLAHEWPQLAAAPVHLRSDGMKIRLLHPPRLAAQPQRLTHIVFPEYNPSSAGYAERLSPLRSLSSLNEGGMLPARRLKRDTFEAFLRLIMDTPSYAMQYASLERAEQIIDDLPHTARD
ncbi:hypothetical protein [Paracidobacterium acidisoli]|uniref:Uncharacterized protein n=1 Tax=Paracidobacterium acidisoli TaxID=2303751 RepID=A0A372IK66_9BACT|nr:hypothetical protein [Paracidobacterium acidisoli]MBT9332630.1 hypothetical protein [Paracidobacterium acidisoli]